MRTVFLAFIPVISAVLGYLFSIKYGQTKEFWDKFTFWHKKIKTEIAFSQNSLYEIFEESKKPDPFSDYVKEYVRGANVPNKPSYLSEEEINFVDRYLQNLGTTDKESQLNLLNSMEFELGQFYQKAENKNKIYRTLYVKLGFLFGLIAFILLL